MKKLFLHLAMCFYAVPAFAAESASVVDWSSVIAQVIVGLLLVILPVLGGLAAKLITKKIKESDNKIDDRLAAIAVAWAEDRLGKGEKLQGAAKKLLELTKGKISANDAETVIAATYQRIKGEIAPLKNA